MANKVGKKENAKVCTQDIIRSKDQGNSLCSPQPQTYYSSRILKNFSPQPYYSSRIQKKKFRLRRATAAE
jgi:hypothetical protein